MIYILIMNVIGFCLMGLDKHRARTRQWRVPEKILFGAALLGGECHLLATTFEWADAIDAERAARSKARAEALLAQKNLDKRDMQLAEARLRRALVRSSVAARKDI